MTLTVEDRLAVADVLYHYATCIDSRCPERLTEVFAEQSDVNVGYGRWSTAQEVSAAIGAMIENVSGTCHAVTNVRVEPADEGAAASSHVTAWHWNSTELDRPADFVLVGRYRDLLQRTPDGWRIVRRRAEAFGPSPVGSGTVPDIFQPGKRGASR